MVRKAQLVFLAVLYLFLSGCKDEFRRNGMYDRPSWLAGKLYTQIKAQPELSTFAECIHLTGYDTIIDVSGSYTVFAPDNDAFTLYFQTHPQYTSVDQIPVAELKRIVKYHIIQNAWSTDQLKQLDVYGWIDTSDLNNNEPRGYKRETLLEESNRSYGILPDPDNKIRVVDSTQSGFHRRQVTDSRKYVPIFYKQYFDIYKLSPNDYSFYYDRPFESASDIYYAGGKITKGNIFAENGFVHEIDRVVDPMPNAYQIMDDKTNSYSYSEFLDLINTFPTFTYNNDKTKAQPGAKLGYQVDSLFDITYPKLTFGITNELTYAPAGTSGLPGNVTIRYQYGLVAPTNQAMDDFVNEYLSGPSRWGNLQSTPYHIKRMIINTHMSNYPIYPSQFASGFTNGEKDVVPLDPSTIVQKMYASNCTFIGVNKMIVPRAFTSVTGPVYTQKGYSFIMYAIEQSGLLSALKRENQHYMFYVEADESLRVDSSLVYYPPSKPTDNGRFLAFQKSGGTAQQVNLTTNDLRTLILNHIGTQYPKGAARKEFIPNLAGNYLVVNNATGEVSGTAPTTVGYRGTTITNVYPTQISANADNGKTFSISNWFNFGAQTLYVKIASSFPKFQALLKKAGLTDDKLYKYNFLSDNENYTVLAPTDSALINFNTDTLTIPELKQFCMLHFIQGALIFTDGNQPSGYYPTMRIDDSSTPYTTIFNKIYINTGYDVISIPDNLGGTYLSIDESPLANVITGRNLGTGTEAIPVVVSNGVVHAINKVLLFPSLVTK